jgi:L-rhamnose mutarotase
VLGKTIARKWWHISRDVIMEMGLPSILSIELQNVFTVGYPIGLNVVI